MACGRSANQSNLVAVFMLQQHDKCHGLVVASRHKLERLTSGDILGACIWRDGGLSARLARCGLPIGCARRFASRKGVFALAAPARLPCSYCSSGGVFLLYAPSKCQLARRATGPLPKLSGPCGRPSENPSQNWKRRKEL